MVILLNIPKYNQDMFKWTERERERNERIVMVTIKISRLTWSCLNVLNE